MINLTSSRAEGSSAPRIAYVHIAKSAGTWLRSMLERNYSPDDACNFRFQAQFDAAPRESYIQKKLFCAHMNYQTAVTLDAALVTVLRNPFDRILSLYSYWKEVKNGPEIVKDMEFDQFLDYHFEGIGQDIDNAQTWQLAFGHTIKPRRANVSLSKDEVLAQAISNLERFSVIGVYEDLNAVAAAMQGRFGITSVNVGKRLNATKERVAVSSLTLDQRRRIYGRNDMDLALYDHVVERVRCGKSIVQ